MRTSLLGRPPLSAQSNSGHGYGYVFAAVSQGPRLASRVLLPVRSGTTVPRAFAGPSAARVAAPAPALRFSAAPPTSRRQVVQTAAAGSGAAAGGANSGGRGSGRGYRGSGTGRGGGSRGRGSPPADDQTLEELRAVVSGQLPGWVARRDKTSIWRAFNKAAKLRSGNGTAAATAARIRSGIIADLSAAYLPLVPAVCAAVECSIPLWAMAKVGIESGSKGAELAAALLERLLEPAVLSTAKSIELSNALYAMGKLREDWEQNGGGWEPAESGSVGVLADEIKGRLTAAVGHGFNAQDVSNALWACAKMGYADAELLQRLAEAGAAVAGDMTPQALSNSLWALKALRCTGSEHQSAIGALCGEALRRLKTPQLAATYKPQHLSNILLALEGLQLGVKQAALVAAVAAEGVRRGFEDYAAQNISNSAWALAKMGFGVGPEAPAEQRQWFTAAVDAAMRQVSSNTVGASPHAWANLLYTLALVRHQPPAALLDARVVTPIVESGNGQDCANTLYALAVLRLSQPGLEAAVCGRLRELLRRKPEVGADPEQHIAISLWALAVLGGATAEVMDLAAGLAREAVARRGTLVEMQMCQLWQAQQALGGTVAEILGSSPEMVAGMKAAVESERARARFSPMQTQVLEALQRMRQMQDVVASVRSRVTVEGVLGRVEAMARLIDGRELAVEVVVATRILANGKGDLSAVDGPMLLRIRQLRRALGWEGCVVLVPYWDWQGLKSPEEQEAYLLRRLQEVAVMAAETQAAEAAAKGAGKTAARTSAAGAAAAPAPARHGCGGSSSSSSSPGSSSPGSPQLLTRPPRRPV